MKCRRTLSAGNNISRLDIVTIEIILHRIISVFGCTWHRDNHDHFCSVCLIISVKVTMIISLVSA